MGRWLSSIQVAAGALDAVVIGLGGAWLIAGNLYLAATSFVVACILSIITAVAHIIVRTRGRSTPMLALLRISTHMARDELPKKLPKRIRVEREVLLVRPLGFSAGGRSFQ